MAQPASGYQPRNTPAERRAFFDQHRCCTDLRARVEALEAPPPEPPPEIMLPIVVDPLQPAYDYTATEIAGLRTEMLAAIAFLRNEVYYTRRFRAYWQYSNTATSPPGAGQIRTNVPISMLYISKTDSDGFNRDVQLDFVPHGALIRVRGATGSVFELRSTGPSTDHGTWFDIPVTVISGTDGDKGFRIELTMFSGIWSEDPP